MKYFVSVGLLNVFSALVIFGSTLVDGESGDLGSEAAAGGASSDNGAGVCEVQLPAWKPTMSHVLTEHAYTCVADIEDGRAMKVGRSNNTEVIRSAFKEACDKKQSFTQCLAAVKLEAEKCLEGVERTRLKLICGLVETQFEVECHDDGQRSAIIYKEQRKHFNHTYKVTSDIMSNCLTGAYRRVPRYTLDETPNQKMVYKYKILQDAEECLAKHKGQGEDTLVDAGVAQWTETMDKIKCVDSQDGTEILCKTIIDGCVYSCC